MNRIKTFIKKHFTNFAYFYSHLGYRIFVILGLSLLAGLLDGFGLAMFLPLLEFVNADSVGSNENMGKLKFLVEILESFNLSLTLTVILITMFFFFLMKGIARFLESYKSVVYHQFFIRNIREESIVALSNYGYDHFVNADAGRIQNTLSGELGRVSAALQSYIGVMQSSMLVLVYTTLAFLSNAEFALMVIIGGALTNAAFQQLYRATLKYSRSLTKIGHSFQGLLIQQVAFFKYLKATGLIKDYAKKLIEKVYLIEDSQKRIGILSAIMGGIREPLMIGVVVVVIMIQVNMMGASLGLILLSILFFYRALSSVMVLQQQWNAFLGDLGAIENLNQFTCELKKGEEKTGGKLIQNMSNQIELENVFFTYGSTPVLKGINLIIPKNETVAFVGESGSGKTTLMNILSGILKPDNGTLRIDGKNLNDYQLESYQKRIGYITQEPVIFNETIFNNVTFWDEYSAENLNRFQKACNQAQIFDYIKTLPDLENAMLGNNGINLSGGQKQRISIARELYKEVDFLFLDEATSSLDSETEKEIQMNIERLKGKYTIVVIAHRLSTIKNADRVVVLSDGQIERIGSYQELIGESEAFKRMVLLQEI